MVPFRNQINHRCILVCVYYGNFRVCVTLYSFRSSHTSSTLLRGIRCSPLQSTLPRSPHLPVVPRPATHSILIAVQVPPPSYDDPTHAHSPSVSLFIHPLWVPRRWSSPSVSYLWSPSGVAVSVTQSLLSWTLDPGLHFCTFSRHIIRARHKGTEPIRTNVIH